MIVGTFEVQAVTNYKIKPKKTQTNRVFFFVFFFPHSGEQYYNTPLVSLHSTFLCVSFLPSSTCSLRTSSWLTCPAARCSAVNLTNLETTRLFKKKKECRRKHIWGSALFNRHQFCNFFCNYAAAPF